jgi:hypothetical protein
MAVANCYVKQDHVASWYETFPFPNSATRAISRSITKRGNEMGLFGDYEGELHHTWELQGVYKTLIMSSDDDIVALCPKLGDDVVLNLNYAEVMRRHFMSGNERTLSALYRRLEKSVGNAKQYLENSRIIPADLLNLLVADAQNGKVTASEFINQMIDDGEREE